LGAAFTLHFNYVMNFDLIRLVLTAILNKSGLTCLHFLELLQLLAYLIQFAGAIVVQLRKVQVLWLGSSMVNSLGDEVDSAATLKAI